MFGVGNFSSTTLGGITLSAAPDLDLYLSAKTKISNNKTGNLIRPNYGPEVESENFNYSHKKKYAKEAWPGKKTNASAV